MMYYKTIQCSHCKLPIRLRITEYKDGSVRIRTRKPYGVTYKHDTGIIKASMDIPPLQCPCCGTRISKLKEKLRNEA